MWRTMMRIDGFTPAFGMSSPGFLVYKFGFCKPDIPGQNVTRNQHIPGSYIEYIHDQMIESVDDPIIRVLDRSYLYLHITDRPGLLFMPGKIGAFKTSRLPFPYRENGFILISGFMG